MVSLHPWEIDEEQPRLSAGLKSRIRQYTGLKSMFSRLERLLTAYSFTTARETFAQECGNCNGQEAMKSRMAIAQDHVEAKGFDASH
jgi:hypothetical protein